MAKLSKGVVKNGRLIRVSNEKRLKFSNANTEYYAIWVEDANGKNERCLLLTDKQIKDAEYRALRNKEDLTKKNFLTNFAD